MPIALVAFMSSGCASWAVWNILWAQKTPLRAEQNFDAFFVSMAIWLITPLQFVCILVFVKGFTILSQNQVARIRITSSEGEMTDTRDKVGDTYRMTVQRAESMDQIAPVTATTAWQTFRSYCIMWNWQMWSAWMATILVDILFRSLYFLAFHTTAVVGIKWSLLIPLTIANWFFSYAGWQVMLVNPRYSCLPMLCAKVLVLVADYYALAFSYGGDASYENLTTRSSHIMLAPSTVLLAGVALLAIGIFAGLLLFAYFQYDTLSQSQSSTKRTHAREKRALQQALHHWRHAWELLQRSVVYMVTTNADVQCAGIAARSQMNLNITNSTSPSTSAFLDYDRSGSKGASLNHSSRTDKQARAAVGFPLALQPTQLSTEEITRLIYTLSGAKPPPVPDIKQALNHLPLFTAFGAYLKSQHCEENLTAYTYTTFYPLFEDPGARRHYARVFCEDFVVVESQHQVNIQDALRNKILNGVESAPLDLFSLLQEELLNVMLSRWHEFVQTPSYKKLAPFLALEAAATAADSGVSGISSA
jgi:hypothetical protein